MYAIGGVKYKCFISKNSLQIVEFVIVVGLNKEMETYYLD